MRHYSTSGAGPEIPGAIVSLKDFPIQPAGEEDGAPEATGLIDSALAPVNCLELLHEQDIEKIPHVLRRLAEPVKLAVHGQYAKDTLFHRIVENDDLARITQVGLTAHDKDKLFPEDPDHPVLTHGRAGK